MRNLDGECPIKCLHYAGCVDNANRLPQDITINHPPGMNIKMLLPACEESRRLIDWVEGGEKHAEI